VVVSPTNVRYLVLGNADRILDMGLPAVVEGCLSRLLQRTWGCGEWMLGRLWVLGFKASIAASVRTKGGAVRTQRGFKFQLGSLSCRVVFVRQWHDVHSRAAVESGLVSSLVVCPALA
jgi:hypothetical protein